MSEAYMRGNFTDAQWQKLVIKKGLSVKGVKISKRSPLHGALPARLENITLKYTSIGRYCSFRGGGRL